MKLEEEIKQKAFLSAHQKATINLIFTNNWLQNQHQDFFKPFGITPQQFNILRILKGQHPKKISSNEVKSRMLDRNSDVSRLLDRLLAKKLIIKNISTFDKRVTEVFISENGISLLEEIQKQSKGLYGLLKLTEAEAQTLNQLLDRARG